ncbi:protein tamozhennic-like [Pollicipes pollicipes]|uniref:protein tamozhennic-like n=1 Tax=Pollicipes pollicipes TaxID=41117 RepID=UPI0018858663|nr:protein tamozhennic-like [Pollicipes pollicipes]
MMMAAKLPARLHDQHVMPTSYQDNTKELWTEIWNTLMGYIDAEDSPNKLHQKDILVDLMSVFLSRVPHDSKFYLAATPAVLRASAEQASFRPLPAAQAFEALHEYAIRILAQPWRSEFTTINMYSGYYVHTVQSRLLEAHRLLEEMGFHVDLSTLTARLVEPVDVDQVTKAAIDTLMASVECRLIERILESLPPGAFTPRGVLCYRSAYVGGVESAIRHLTVSLRQRSFQHYFSPPGEEAGAAPAGGAFPWQPVPPAPPPALPPVPTARLVDVGERDGCVWIPKTIRHQSRPAAEQRPAPAAAPPPAAAMLPATLDEHQLASWDLVDRNAVPARARPPSESLDDSWGYVLQSLDRRRPASGRYDNVPEQEPAGRGQAPRAAAQVAERRVPAARPRGRAETRHYGETDQRNPFDSRSHLSSSLYHNGASPGRDVRDARDVRQQTAESRGGPPSRGASLTLEHAAAPPADAEQWACHACTYLNPAAVRVCTMCGKTRQPCTLLNSRRARKCGACDAELK